MRMKTSDMFASLKPPRQPPRKLMHVCDAGSQHCYADDEPISVRYKCYRCGHETDWMGARTVTDAKRGIPCPKCNEVPHA